MEANFKKFLLFATPYSFLVAILYHLGYWSTFDINIFSFLSINEVALSAVIPLFILIIASVLSFVLGEFSVPSNNTIKQLVSPETSKAKKFIYIVFMFLLPIGIVIYTVFQSVEDLWYSIIIIPVFCYLFLIPKNFMIDYFKNESVRSVIVFSICALPFMSFLGGKQYSFIIQDFKDGTYALSDDLKSTNLDSGTKLILLGEAGDYFFFQTDSTKNILIKKIGSFQDLIFYKKEE